MISKRLSELRKKKKWSLQYTADRLGIAKSTYAGYESGYRQPSLEAVRELAKLFGTSTDYLLGSVDTPSMQGSRMVELTETLLGNDLHFMIDGKPLSRDELNQIIAFVRVRREIETI